LGGVLLKILCYICAMLKVTGNIIEGNKVGREIGFPTMNLSYDGRSNGVFVGRLVVKEVSYPCAVNLGHRPTVDDNVGCEIYVVDDDFRGLEYGTYIEIEILTRIREIKKFDNMEALKEAIVADVVFVKNWYNSVN